jgi:hypothetical protein
MDCKYIKADTVLPYSSALHLMLANGSLISICLCALGITINVVPNRVGNEHRLIWIYL